MGKMKEDIIYLQEQYVHMQAAIEQMSEELYLQQKTIVKLEKDVKCLEGRLGDQIRAGEQAGNWSQEKPPHY